MFRRPPVYHPARASERPCVGLKRAASGLSLSTAPTKRLRLAAQESADAFGGGPDVAMMRGAAIVRRMTEFHQTLVRSNTSPTPAQVLMQSNVLRALTPLMFAADWAVHKNAIKEYMHVTPESDRSIHVFECPRRFGKTLSSAQIAAMVLLSFEGIRMCVISTGDRVAKYFIGEVATVLRQLTAAGMGRKGKIEYSQTHIDITFTDERGVSYKNTLISVPAVVDTVRGTTAQFFFADEANFMDMDIFFKVIFPLVQVSGTILLCASSPNSSTVGPSATLWNAKMPNGELCVHKICITLVCEACKKRGITTCPHNQHVLPPWHNAGIRTVIKRLYESAGDAYRQEILGDGSADSVDAFIPSTFEHLSNPARAVPFPSCIQVILVSFDPSGGSKFSNDSGAAVYLDDETGNFVVSFTRTPAAACRPRPPSSSQTRRRQCVRAWTSRSRESRPLPRPGGAAAARRPGPRKTTA